MEKFKKSFDFTDLELKTTNIFEIDELSTNYEIFAKELSKSYKQLRSLLEELEMKNIELKNLNKQLENSYIEFAKKLAEIAEIYDEETGNHIERVGVIAGFIAKKLRLSAETVLKIEQFAPLHDIGKLLVPKEILLKRGKLTSKEWEIIKMHTVYGAKIIGDNPNYRIAKNIALYHHEKYDGSGYPYGLKNDEIPIEAAITTIADVYDALRSFRPYKKAISHEEAIRILKEGDNRTRPESFHPEILKVFLDNEREIKEIWEKNFKVAKKDKI
ncbi:MAG: HD domain-containing protein [Thermosipho sp. (in: Bacteria)]|nr:HD domain-containing protein [Thermosipho sp. (in: thermotogales)]